MSKMRKSSTDGMFALRLMLDLSKVIRRVLELRKHMLGCKVVLHEEVRGAVKYVRVVQDIV